MTDILNITTIKLTDYIKVNKTTLKRKGDYPEDRYTDPITRKPIWINRRVDGSWCYIDEEGIEYRVSVFALPSMTLNV